MVCCQRRVTSFAVNLLSVPKVWRTKGGAFSFKGWASTTYTWTAIGFLIYFCISSTNFAKNELDLGIPDCLSIGNTIPTIWLVLGSYPILLFIPVASSHSQTMFSAPRLRRYSFSSALFSLCIDLCSPLAKRKKEWKGSEKNIYWKMKWWIHILAYISYWLVV